MSGGARVGLWLGLILTFPVLVLAALAAAPLVALVRLWSAAAELHAATGARSAAPCALRRVVRYFELELDRVDRR